MTLAVNKGLLPTHRSFADQVSLDPNKLLWMEQTLGLPWICVRDANTIQSTYISAYNLYDFPALFLINREGDIVARPSYNELSAAVSKLM